VKRRLLAALAAILSTALGAGLLLTYVAGADRRAMAGLAPVQVLVAAKAVPAGTAGADMTDLVTTKTVPVAALVPGAVEDVSSLSGLVATADLEPGEQVLASRFADPATLTGVGRPARPRGMQEVALDLDPQRVVGGNVVAGARVAAFTTIDKRTRLALGSVLVTRVDTTPTSSEGAPAAAPTDGHVRLTLAVTAAEATKLLSGAENGTVWFSLVSDAPSTPTRATVPEKSVTP
jgi:pilus assembly protein CpaB